ncbi:MAG: hypothetical protein ACK5GJ_00325, partial [Planctomycetota bacterium]
YTTFDGHSQRGLQQGDCTRTQLNGARARARKDSSRLNCASASERQLHSIEQFPSSDYEQEHEHEFNEF